MSETFDAKNITIPFAISVFPTSCIRRRGAGQSVRTPTTSSITTSSTEAAISPPGNSRNPPQKRCAATSSSWTSGR